MTNAHSTPCSPGRLDAVPRPRRDDADGRRPGVHRRALAAGRMAVVVDDADGEDEGDLVLAADTATPEQLAFLVRHGTGIVCVPMEGARLDALGLPGPVGGGEERSAGAGHGA